MKIQKISERLKFLKSLFWDYNWESVFRNLDSPFVIARVFEIGKKLKIFL